jgi:hypothetical protein
MCQVMQITCNILYLVEILGCYMGYHHEFYNIKEVIYISAYRTV